MYAYLYIPIFIHIYRYVYIEVHGLTIHGGPMYIEVQ